MFSASVLQCLVVRGSWFVLSGPTCQLYRYGNDVETAHRFQLASKRDPEKAIQQPIGDWRGR